jgi:hypothetical protein
MHEISIDVDTVCSTGCRLTTPRATACNEVYNYHIDEPHPSSTGLMSLGDGLDIHSHALPILGHFIINHLTLIKIDNSSEYMALFAILLADAFSQEWDICLG